MRRIALLLATGLTSAFIAGRHYASREVDQAKRDTIEKAVAISRHRIRHSAGEIITESCIGFARRMLVKVALVATLLILRWTDVMPHDVFVIVFPMLMSFIFIRDLITGWPFIKVAFREFRAHGFHLKDIAGKLVAAEVYDHVHKEASAQNLSALQILGLSLTGQTQDSFSRDIARAVADASRKTSWRDLGPYLLWAGSSIAALMMFYSAFVAMAFQLG